MAKRKRVTPPTAAELAEMEAGFAPTPSSGPMAPIAQVAGDAAAMGSPLSAEERAADAQDRADAESYRAAKADGGLILNIPLTEVSTDQMARDRMELDAEALAELKASIKENGLRLPIEVFTQKDGGYGLLSGYRRLFVLRELYAETGESRFATIRAVMREPDGLAEAFTAMVEENEVRAGLSPYERGRIAALSTHQGAFNTIDDAVAKLFFAASKAKRSKVRSFALIHEELGDLLTFPAQLTERMGLRLSNALREGFAEELRGALATGQGTMPDLEWELLEPWILTAEKDQTEKRRRGGRRVSSKPVKRLAANEYPLGPGQSCAIEHDGRNYCLRFKGPDITADLVDMVAAQISGLLRRE